MRSYTNNITAILAFLFFSHAFAQTEATPKEVALNIMNQAAFCSFTTIDDDGLPESRMMQTLRIEKDFIIWLGTKPNTQKVAQVKNNPNVSVYYTEAHSTGYVNIQGKAEIINDNEIKEKHWKEGWEAFYADKDKDFVLIRITPLKLQMVSYAHGIISEKEDWSAKEIIFQ